MLVRIEKFHMTWMVLCKGVTVSQCSYKVYMCPSSEVRFDDSVFVVIKFVACEGRKKEQAMEETGD